VNFVNEEALKVALDFSLDGLAPPLSWPKVGEAKAEFEIVNFGLFVLFFLVASFVAHLATFINAVSASWTKSTVLVML